MELGDRADVAMKPYQKDIGKYVMMPGMAKKRHIIVEQRMKDIRAFAETSGSTAWNTGINPSALSPAAWCTTTCARRCPRRARSSWAWYTRCPRSSSAISRKRWINSTWWKS